MAPKPILFRTLVVLLNYERISSDLRVGLNNMQTLPNSESLKSTITNFIWFKANQLLHPTVAVLNAIIRMHPSCKKIINKKLLTIKKVNLHVFTRSLGDGYNAYSSLGQLVLILLGPRYVEQSTACIRYSQ